jgi:hypothetical protein
MHFEFSTKTIILFKEWDIDSTKGNLELLIWRQNQEQWLFA